VRSGGRSEWDPRFRGWRRGSLYRGDEEEFLVHGEKRGGDGEEFLVHGEKMRGDREAAGDDFIPYMTTFLLLGMG
jgi:hypothetical protein